MGIRIKRARGLAPHQRIHTPLALIEGSQEQMIEAVAGNLADLALLYNVPACTEVSVRRVASLPPHVLLPAAHPLAHAHSVSLRDLAGEPMVLLDTRAPHAADARRRAADPLAGHRPSSETARIASVICW